MNIPPHTAVVSAVPPVGHPTYFSQFYNPNLASWFPATASPTPAVCNPLVLNESSCLFEAVTSVAPPKSVKFLYKTGAAFYYFSPPNEQVPL